MMIATAHVLVMQALLCGQRGIKVLMDVDLSCWRLIIRRYCNFYSLWLIQHFGLLTVIKQ